MPSLLSRMPFYDASATSSSTSTSSSPPSAAAQSSLLIPLISTFLCFLYFTSSPLSTNHELTKFSLYKSINVYLHTWCFATVLLYSLGLKLNTDGDDNTTYTAINALNKYNVVVSASIFIPAFISTLAAVLTLKGLLRLTAHLRTLNSSPPIKSSVLSLKWWRPLRQVFNVAIFIATVVAAVQGHCWDAKNNSFYTQSSSVYCRWIFSQEDGEPESGGGGETE